MPNGKPFISSENVRSALDRLVYTASHSDTNALENLLIVSDVVSRPEFPTSSRGREYALNSLLTSAIISHFKQLRHIYGRLLESLNATLHQAVNEITLDAQQGAPELVGWGWFYYHYVRTELNMSQQVFSELVHLDNRTLRRYQQHTLRQLTDYLIEQEQTARAAQRARRLYTELPNQARLALIGRDTDREAVLDILRRNSAHHIQISGIAGVGKSVLVELVVGELIETGAVEEVIWLAHPASIDFIRAALNERFSLEGTTASLRDYLAIYSAVIVLDDVDHLMQDIEQLLQDLSGSTVFLVGRRYLPIRNVPTYMLHELSQEDAYHLMGMLLPVVQDEQIIWSVTGGNPLAIKLAAGYLPLKHHIPSGIEPFFSAVETALREDEWLAWFAFALLPPHPVAITMLDQLWPEVMNSNQVANLIRHHLVEALEVPPDHCLLTHSARQHLVDRYQNDVQVQKRAESLLLSLTHTHEIPIEIVEYLLLAQWLRLPDALGWQKRFWREGIRKGHWGIWKSILQSTSYDVPELRIATGICMRCLGEWTAASLVLSDVMRSAGRTGDFITQAYAMLEQAKSLRYQGQFQNALNLLARSERILSRQQEILLIQEVKLEQVRIAVEQKQIETGFNILSSVPKTLDSQFLWAELYLLSGNYTRCRQLANDAFRETQQAKPIQTRLHTLVGRCYKQEKDLYNAQNHFFAAVSLLEQFYDPFALARAQSNLASVYMEMNQYHDARILLQDAEQIQSQLKDVVGLAITRHNLRLLKPS